MARPRNFKVSATVGNKKLVDNKVAEGQDEFDKLWDTIDAWVKKNGFEYKLDMGKWYDGLSYYERVNPKGGHKQGLYVYYYAA